MSEINQLPPLAESLFVRAMEYERLLDLSYKRYNNLFVEKTQLDAQLYQTRQELQDRDDVIGLLESEAERLQESCDLSEGECDKLCDQINEMEDEISQLQDDKYEMTRRIESLLGQLELQGHDDGE